MMKLASPYARSGRSTATVVVTVNVSCPLPLRFQRVGEADAVLRDRRRKR